MSAVDDLLRVRPFKNPVIAASIQQNAVQDIIISLNLIELGTGFCPADAIGINNEQRYGPKIVDSI